MTVRALRFAAHDVLLDPETGAGVIVLPLPDRDVCDPERVGSLHESAWAYAVRWLASQGWVPSEAEDGAPICEGFTSDGREVLGLCGLFPSQREDIEAEAASFAEMLTLVGCNA